MGTILKKKHQQKFLSCLNEITQQIFILFFFFKLFFYSNTKELKFYIYLDQVYKVIFYLYQDNYLLAIFYLYLECLSYLNLTLFIRNNGDVFY